PLLFITHARHPPPLHSFPTRRSSDLHLLHAAAREAVGPSLWERAARGGRSWPEPWLRLLVRPAPASVVLGEQDGRRRSVPLGDEDRKSTRLNSSHDQISYAVFCLKKK